MLKSLRKIRAVFLAFWQEALMYRAESLVWFIGGTILPLVMIALWLAAYRSVDHIGTYTVQDMVNYYVLFLVLNTLLTPHLEWAMGDSIRSGSFSIHLVRPLSYHLWQLAAEIAYKGVRIVFVVPMLLLFLLLFGLEMLGGFALRWEIAPILLASMVMSFLLNYCLKMCLGLLAFWVGQTAGIIESYAVVTMFLAGSIIPLDLMPANVERVTYFLPFRFLYFFPVQLLQGRLDLMSALSGLAMQAMWLVLAYVLMQWVFAAGVRRYGAYGG
jgi:ABC-2 type transport system permease protein